MFTPKWQQCPERRGIIKTGTNESASGGDGSGLSVLAGSILAIRRTVPCYPVKRTVLTTRWAVTSSAGAGENTSGTSKISGLKKPLICAFTGSCAARLPGSCGRILPDIQCGEGNYKHKTYIKTAQSRIAIRDWAVFLIFSIQLSCADAERC